MMYNGYVLRKAADYYWLIDTRESGENYRKPLVMNKTGAFIWENLVAGKNDEEIAATLKDEKTPLCEIRKDVQAFHEQLSEYTNSLV